MPPFFRAARNDPAGSWFVQNRTNDGSNHVPSRARGDGQKMSLVTAMPSFFFSRSRVLRFSLPGPKTFANAETDRLLTILGE